MIIPGIGWVILHFHGDFSECFQTVIISNYLKRKESLQRLRKCSKPLKEERGIIRPGRNTIFIKKPCLVKEVNLVRGLR